MSTFAATIHEIKLEPHPNADAIELAIIGDYRSIVKIGQYQDGDLVGYIPEAALIPEWLLKQIDFWDDEHDRGKLNGKLGNRVKCVRLRGVLSQGIVIPLDELLGSWILVTPDEFIPVQLGDDITEALEITKYEPPIPHHMSGEVHNAFGMTLKYDIENYKRFPDVLEDGEEVVMTEKLHGTWISMGYHPGSNLPIVTSKGLSDKGIALTINEANSDNIYIRTLTTNVDEDGNDIVARYRNIRDDDDTPFYILGEVFGAGVQDLSYGLSRLKFRVFDIYIGDPTHGRYLSWDEMVSVCGELELETVPLLYRGPFSKDQMLKYTTGKEQVTGNYVHIREGVVVKPTTERYSNVIGRVMLKSISEDYLTRKNATEYT